MKALIWVQHLLGIGHVRRAQALVAALQSRAIEVVVVLGGGDVPGQNFGDAEIVRLPSVRAADATFSGLVDEKGQPADRALLARRRSALLSAFDRTAPDILITETFPFGRRSLRHELLPLLETATAKRPRPLIVASIRDVLVAKTQKEKERWMAETAQRFYDCVLVHGDRSLIPLSETFPFAEQLDNLLFYTGYIGPSHEVPVAGEDSGARDIAVSAGGGAVAERLFRPVISAIPLTGLPSARWRFLTGPDMPLADRQELLRRAGDLVQNVAVEPAVRNLQACLASARLSISQAGYNTVMDILRSNVRALVVPFAAGGESEQALRADALAKRGHLTMLGERDAEDPRKLANAIRLAWQRPRPKRSDLRFDGAQVAADHIVSLANRERSS